MPFFTLSIVYIALPPVNLIDIRYEATADHYWSAANNAATHLTNGNMSIVSVSDLRTGNSASAQVTGSGSALPIPILWTKEQNGVIIANDPLMDFAFVFNTSSCIQIANLTAMALTAYDACLIDPAQCPFGISATVWVRFPLGLISVTTQTALLAIGQNSGFYLYQKGPVTYVTVFTSSGIAYSASGSSHYVQPNQWVCIGFTWDLENGAHIFVNGYDLNENGAGQTMRQTANSATNTPYLSIGCNGGSFAGPISIAHAAVWYYRLRSEWREQSFLNGGFLLKAMRYQKTTSSAPAATLSPNWASQRFDFSTTVELTFPSTVGELLFKQMAY